MFVSDGRGRRHCYTFSAKRIGCSAPPRRNRRISVARCTAFEVVECLFGTLSSNRGQVSECQGEFGQSVWLVITNAANFTSNITNIKRCADGVTTWPVILSKRMRYRVHAFTLYVWVLFCIIFNEYNTQHENMTRVYPEFFCIFAHKSPPPSPPPTKKLCRTCEHLRNV